MTEINPGDVRRVSGSFTNPAGVATDPTTISVRWRHHRGTETTWVYGTDTQVVRDSAGVFHADIPITASGLYYYRFEGTGAVQAAEEGTFLVETFFESASATLSGPIRLYTGTTDPTTGAGVPATIGSVYSRTLLGSESVWVKTGAADMAWTQAGAADGGGAAASPVLEDPGNVWAPGVAVTEGYRIAETVDGALRVFEATTSGTTHPTVTAFTDFTVSLQPLGLTTELVTWRYLGVVGQVGFDVLPGFFIKPADWFVSSTTGELALRYTGDPTDYEDLLVVGDDNNNKAVWRQDSSGDSDHFFRDSGTSHRYHVKYGAVNFFLMSIGEDAVWMSNDTATRFFEYTSATGAIRMEGLPIADPAVAGQLWNDTGTLKVSAG